ncbi:putative AC transposase isoform X1 [Amaranthus tricolor]|uniref:putative AC transposase isoform X1 n=1 Tax=Amaranthus tricolor TaxID=29722 RepID=UPI00258D1C8E|nr:putative AC transposase isoform X1 [Amaranthus tricolor]
MDTNTIESERVHVDSEEDLVEVKSSDTMSKKDPKNIGNKTIHISGKNFKRQRKLTSGVWVNFEFVDETDEDGNLFCKCKKCEKMFRADSKMGTGNLIRHVKNCKMRTFRDVGQMILENSTAGLANKLPVFDVAIFRELLALAIVRHDLPFQFVEYEGIRRLFSYLNPTTKTISRNTSKSDVVKMYEREKENLKFLLGSISSRICLTSDCWSSITSDGYITLTAHYVDDNWVLKKKLLNFCFMPPPHTGVHLSDHVCSLLKDWGILQKIFSITLDNAASNDVFADCLKGELELLCAGEFFHVRCCAHIMNLVVQDGLKEIDDAVIKVRESVKYCKGSQARKQRFLSCIEHVG